MTLKRKSYLFIIAPIIFLFFLWGFAHSLLDVLNKHFQDSFEISKFRSSWIQVALYGGYFLISLPAGYFLKKYSFKKSIILGLLLFGAGAIFFVPADQLSSFPLFLISLFIIGSGLTFLETAANPYVTLLGDPEGASQRLNFAQSFNGLGWILGPMIGGILLFASDGSLRSVSLPYLALGIVVFITAFIFSKISFPKVAETDTHQPAYQAKQTAPLWKQPLFIFGMVAQFLYVGAQTGINSFFINYVIELNSNLTNRDAALLLSIGGMTLFTLGRFLGSWIMRWIAPDRLLIINSTVAIVLTAIVILSLGTVSLIALLLLYLFFSIMFPTIFSLSIKGLGNQTEKGSSLMVMTIVGGAVVPPIMALIGANVMAIGFIVPLICFAGVLSFAIFNRYATH